MDQVEGVFGEHLAGSPGELDVVGDVAGGLGGGHAGHGVAQRGPLFEAARTASFMVRRRAGCPTSRQARGESWSIELLPGCGNSSARRYPTVSSAGLDRRHGRAATASGMTPTGVEVQYGDTGRVRNTTDFRYLCPPGVL